MAKSSLQNQLLCRLAKYMMSQVFIDWEAMVGVEVKIAKPIAMTHPQAKMLGPVLRQDCMVVQTRVEGESEGVLTCIFPTDFVVEVIGEMIMLPREVRDRKRAEGLDDSDIEPFQEMSNLLCGSCNNVFNRLQRDLRVSQSVDHLKVIYSPNDNADVVKELPEGELSTVRLIVELKGERYNVVQTWPSKLAMEIGQLLMKGKAA